MKTAKRSRHQKLMDARVQFHAAIKDPTSQVSAVQDAVDYLFYELGIAILEIGELRAVPKRRKGK